MTPLVRMYVVEGCVSWDVLREGKQGLSLYIGVFQPAVIEQLCVSLSHRDSQAC